MNQKYEPVAEKRSAEADRGTIVETTMTHLVQVDDVEIRFDTENVRICMRFARLGGFTANAC